MQIIRPDYNRRIDLPGAGPCPRPVDIDQSVTGFTGLVSLRVYSFSRGMVIHGEAEEDELFIVLMRGVIEVAVDQGAARVGAFSLRHDHGARAVYMPPQSAYLLKAGSDADVAYARVKPISTPLPEVRAFEPVNDRLDVVAHATGMAVTLAVLTPGYPFAGEEASDAPPERLMHMRSDDGGAIVIAGGELADWDTAALASGEVVTVRQANGTVELLTIAAVPT